MCEKIGRFIAASVAPRRQYFMSDAGTPQFAKRLLQSSYQRQLSNVNKSEMRSAGESPPKNVKSTIGSEKVRPTQNGRIPVEDSAARVSHFASSTSSVSVQTGKMPSETSVLRFVKLTEKAFAPMKGSNLAAGFDLKSAYDYVIPARGKELVKTDIQIKLPEGCYGRVAPRSGLAWKHHIDVGAGVIDADYTGNVGVVLFNHGLEEFHIKAGDRVAQLICERIVYPEIQEVEVINQTERGDGGFGSTGRR